MPKAWGRFGKLNGYLFPDRCLLANPDYPAIPFFAANQILHYQ